MDFLKPMEITPYALVKAIGVDQTRISQLIKGQQSISAEKNYSLIGSYVKTEKSHSK